MIAKSFRTSILSKFLMSLSFFGLFGAGSIAAKGEILLAVPFFLVAVGIGMLAQGAEKFEAWLGDRSRTRVANEAFKDIVRNIRAGRTPRFTLYLRPFKLTGKLNTPRTKLGGGLGVPIMHQIKEALDTDTDIENAIAIALANDAMLLGLGRPGEHYGAGRLVVTDEVWQDAVRVLADRAERIVMMPYPADGTLWEVKLILESSLVDKTVWIMPPSLPGAGNARGFWDRCREFSREKLGRDLPEYDPGGQLFRITSNGVSRRPLPLSNGDRLRTALLDLVPPRAPGAAAQAITEKAESLAKALRIRPARSERAQRLQRLLGAVTGVGCLFGGLSVLDKHQVAGSLAVLAGLSLIVVFGRAKPRLAVWSRS